MAYSEIDQTTLDINWYFKDQYNRVCISASGGGFLPNIITENEEANEEFHKMVMELPNSFAVARNESILNFIQGITNDNLDSYFQDFESLASRGLYVFDKIKLDEPEDGFYLLVAYPIYDPNKDDMPFDRNKLSLIPKTREAIIFRNNQQIDSKNFIPKDLVHILNNQK